MSVTADDLGVLGNLGKAIGLLGSDGDPNPSWFGDPAASLQTVLADDGQRAALIDFVDEALGGADASADPSGATWLPLVELEPPEPRLTVAVTVDDRPSDHITVGLGVAFETEGPASRTTVSVPLFQAAKRGQTIGSPFLLGQVGGRLHLASHVTVDESAPVPGQARLGGVGLEVDLPTAAGDSPAVFTLVLEDFQLPGAAAPQTVRISGSGAEQIEHSVLDLVLSLLRAQAQALGGSPVADLAGLLGLGGDDVPDFPIEQLAADGIAALPAWLESVLDSTPARQAWLGHLAALVGGSVDGDDITLTLGATAAALRLGLLARPGPSGHTQLAATLGVDVGVGSPRVQARADLLRIDLGSGSALGLPSLGVWASIGVHDGAGTAVLDVTDPTVAHADTLRVGFGLDADRKLNFVLAADAVQLGAHSYPTLDLTSPAAVMDAAEHTVDDIATQLLGQLGSSLGAARMLLGLDPPTGTVVPTIGLADLLHDPLGAVAGYWHTLLTAHGDAVTVLLESVRDTFADAGVGALPIRGTGGVDDPWRVALVGPVELEAMVAGDSLNLTLAASTSVDTLGQRCTVLETRLAATLAVLDLAGSHVQLLPSVEGALNARERGVTPPQVTLPLGGGAALTATGVGFSLRWAAGRGLAAALETPALSLQLPSGQTLPVAFPTIGADGNATLPPEAWDALQALLGEVATLLPGLVGELVELAGWRGGGTGLRLADLVADPGAALAAWLPELALGELGPVALGLGLLADLLTAAGPAGGAIAGTGSPDDPIRIALDTGGSLPELAVWFPPAGLERPVVAAPQALRLWRPGDPPLDAGALASAIAAEGMVDSAVRDLADGRDVASGLAALTTRWTGNDGAVVPPATAPDGITVQRVSTAARGLAARLDLEDELGRVPSTVVHVAIGAGSWPDAPADRLVDLTATGLAPAMFTAPAPVAGDWFVALGTRAACKLVTGDDDGTLGQAQRLQVVLDALAPLGNDLVVVALAGAGHAARLAAQAQAAVSDLVTLGTPLGPVSLTVLSTQPGADALRLLGRLLPPAAEGEDDDLALGRQLVSGALALVGQADPAGELRLPATELTAPRAGLSVTALFGTLAGDQVGRAVTAIVAAGLATRARARAAQPLPVPTGVDAGIRFSLPASTAGALAIDGDAVLRLVGFDLASGPTHGLELRARVSVRDRLGWLAATPETALRMLSLDVTVPLAGASGPGHAAVTLHDARALGTDQERLTLATGADVTALLPEARVLLAVAVERLVADATNPLAAQLVALLEALGLVAAGGAVPDAFEQLLHDPAGLVDARLAAARSELATALASLLGPAGAGIDLATGRLTVTGGSPASGLFGWSGRLDLAAAGIGGDLAFGPAGPPGAAGALQLVVTLAPFAAGLHWRQPGGVVEDIALWPQPQGAALARAFAHAAPGLGGQLALELMRRADEDARPLIDAALDALGLLGGSPSDELRPLRPLAGLLADPAGWLRSSESIGAQPAKAQALLDALRPLTGLGGSAGDPLPLASGVALAVAADGPDLALALSLDSSGWAPVDSPLGRLAAAVTAGLTVGAAATPRASLELQAGLAGAAGGRSAVHVRLAGAGIAVFLRPGSGADIALVPFAGLGSLADAAELALPFLLDQLAGVAGPVGAAVGGVGDALALRSGAPAKFDSTRLAAWAADPAAALATAVPSIVHTGLETLAPLLDGVVPAAVTVTGSPTDLTVAVGAVSLGWSPSDHRVSLNGSNIVVPGIEHLSFTVAVSDSGLQELSVAVGPAALDAGGTTLRPFASFAVGAGPAGGRRVAAGLALDDTHRFAARWLLDGGGFALAASDGPLAGATDLTDPAAVALRAVETVAELVAAVALGTAAVQELLDHGAGAGHVRDMLRGVLLEDVVNPTGLVAGLFDPTTVLARAQHLLANLAGIGLTVTVDGLQLSLTTVDGVIGLQLGLAQRMPLVSGDVSIWLENDDSWIENHPAGPGGLFVGVLRPGGLPQFEPSLAVEGVGLRFGKSGPLLDVAGLTLGIGRAARCSAASAIGRTAGGVEVQLSDLGSRRRRRERRQRRRTGRRLDSGKGSNALQPKFTPALAVQKRGNGPVLVALRAGDGSGPWWIAIQKGFGPLYIEQVGFGVTMQQDSCSASRCCSTARVSLFGLTAAVDDLQLTFVVASDGDGLRPGQLGGRSRRARRSRRTWPASRSPAAC